MATASSLEEVCCLFARLKVMRLRVFLSVERALIHGLKIFV